MTGGVQRGLSELVDTGVAWVEIGTVSAIEDHADLGHLLTLELQPSGREIQARFVVLGSRAAGGLFFPVQTGDEVLVLLPGGDPNRAVALGGLVSRESAIPSSWGNDTPQMVHPNGLELRTTEAATVQRVVTEDHLPDLQSAMTEILALFGALASLGITLPSTSTTQLVANLPTMYRTRALKSE